MPKEVTDKDIVCMICGAVERDPAKVLECVQCYVCHHFSCKKITGTAVPKMRQKPYFCSVECQKMHSAATGADSVTANEMRQVLNDFKQNNAQTLQVVANSMQEIKSSQEFLSAKFDGMMGEITSLKTDQKILKSEMNFVKEEYSRLNTTVDNLECELDRLKRATLARNAVLLGIPITHNEIVKEVVLNVAKTIKCDLPADAITEASRFVDSKGQGKIPPIKIVFADEKSKELFFNTKRAAGQLSASSLGAAYAGSKGRVIIRDELTQHGLTLLRETRDVQEQLDLKYVWPGRDGVILVKKTQDSKIEKIRNRGDICKLGRTNKRNLNSSMNNTSSSMESSPKRQC